MSHNTIKSGYQKLTERLNKFPQGAPPSELLYGILKILVSEKEAEMMSKIPIKPFTVEAIAKIWGKSASESEKTLNNMAERGIIVDVEENGKTTYVMTPPMAGFFEFSLMRVRKDIDQKALSELFHQYLNVEEDFIKALFTDGETQLGRVFVNETVLSEDNMLHVLDYEKVSEIVETAAHIAVGMCYCRHKMEHLGKNCDAPMDVCLTFNNAAKSLTKHNIARTIDKSECLDLIQLSMDHNLVQFGENVQQNVNFICNCCGCCCEAMLAAKKFGMLNPVHTTGFIPLLEKTLCNGCMKCVSVCPVASISMESKKAEIDESTCLGCGLCVKVCPVKAIKLERRTQKIITPVDSVHRVVMMAIERGKLQNLIFDNQALWNHRAMAAILGVILKLPPAKQIIASKQMKSRYLYYLLNKTRSG
jgi:ferredoxin